MPIMAFAQGFGCVYDEKADGNAPKRPKLMLRDYTVLPDSFSMKKYCPIPKSQDIYGTCTAWATTYAARTICEAINNNWITVDKVSKEAFAPIFIYKQLNTELGCDKGTSICNALSLLITKGAPKFSSFEVLCADTIPSKLYVEASNYKIDSYTQLFNDLDPRQQDVNKVEVVKKALFENHPVVFSMNVYKSFWTNDVTDPWNGLQDSIMASHAMCVIGYNNKKYGGAFEIMNSWGTDWGTDGFLWIKYDDFCKHSKLAYDVYLKKKVQHDTVKPRPIPVSASNKCSMAGRLSIVGKDGGDTSRVMINDNGDLPYYVMADEFISGKRFRLIVSNDEPAWVYVLASDKTNKVNTLFPGADDINISPYLNYSKNDIALPSESGIFKLDDTAGTDYFCVLYSQEELDINGLARQIQKAEGSFYQKLKTVLGESIVSQEDIRYIRNYIGFSAKTDRPIVPLVVEITHKEIDVINYPDN